MSLPIASYAVTVSTNITICQLVAGLPNTVTANTQFSYPMLDNISWIVAGGSTGVGSVLTLQELGGDGTWRALVTAPFAPITIVNSTTVNGPTTAGFVCHGIRRRGLGRGRERDCLC